MRKNYIILNNIKGLTIFDKLLLNILKKYTYKIYSEGYKSGFYYANVVDNVNNLSTMHKLFENILR